MNKNTIIKSSFIFASIFCSSLYSKSQENESFVTKVKASIEEQGLSAGIQINTLGLGGQFVMPLNNSLNARFSASFIQMKFQKNVERGNLAEDRNRKLRSGGLGLLVDWKPFEYELIRFSGGLVYQFNRASESRDYVYTRNGEAMELGNLTVDFTFFPVNPYIGFVFGRPIPLAEKKISVLFELGTLFHGRPRVDFTGAGRIAPTAEQDDVIANNVKNYMFYPVASIQLNYKIK
jgi:hypothetical protein